MNPLSGEASDELVLIEGQHRQVGTRYESTGTYVQVGVHEQRSVVTLREDSARTLAFTLTDDSGQWGSDISIEHGRLPKVEVSGRIEVFWATSGSETASLGQAVAELRASIEHEGGAAPLVHRVLWDDAVDADLGTFGGGSAGA